MSQCRVRKPSTGRASGVRPPAPAQACTPCTQQRPSEPRKSWASKLPKNVRYDLENALLSLCDVWFEEIKPYLVRNKMKLHSRRRPDADGPEPCSHLDPDSGAAECSLCRLLQRAATGLADAVSATVVASGSAGGSVAAQSDAQPSVIPSEITIENQSTSAQKR